MKKIICLFISLIFVLSLASFAFADGEGLYRYDAVTGELVDYNTGASTNYAKVTSDCTYNKASKRYIYSTSTTSNTDVECSVFDGMITTDYVELVVQTGANVVVYKDGEEVSPEDYDSLVLPGSYIVRNRNTDSIILSFTIVKELTSKITSYRIPFIFDIQSARFNGHEVNVSNNFFEMTEDGEYYVSYRCLLNDTNYTLHVNIDHTYPELEIFGVEDGIANGPVSFGELEEESDLVIMCNGSQVDMIGDELKNAGDYTVKYTDAAGNTSTYYFTINIFFDAGAWVFLALALAIAALAIGYMVYCRKNMRTR